MNLQQLQNPKKITGFLVWRNGKCIEVDTDEKTAIQETKGRLEIWEQWSGERIILVERFNKKSITHYCINNEFVLPY